MGFSRSFRLLASLLVVLVIPANICLAQEAQRAPLSLFGCTVTGVSENADGSVLLAGCSGPKGLYWSFDFGTNWSFAAGGDYSSGAANAVAISGGTAFAIVDGNLLRSTVGSSAWQSVAAVGSAGIKDGAGYLLITGSPTLQILNPLTLQAAAARSVPSGAVIGDAAIVQSFIFAVADGVLYRAQFDPSSGAIVSDWSDLSSVLGAPVSRIFINQQSKRIYVALNSSAAVLFSDNNGVSFTASGLAASPKSACFSGSAAIIGTYLSKDGGASWSDVTLGTSKRNQVEDIACVISPANPALALVSTKQGFKQTTNLLDRTPNFIPRMTGLDGANAFSLSQAAGGSSRVVVSTTSGLAFTAAYQNNPPTWIYPLCPNGECFSDGRAAADSLDPNYFYYVGSSLMKVRTDIDAVSGVTAITWAEIGAKPDLSFKATVLFTSPLIPNRVVSGYQRSDAAVGGALYVYDTSGTVISAAFPGSPISAFAVTSAASWFVGLGTDLSAAPAYRGLFSSADSGKSWAQISSASVPLGVYVRQLAYDSGHDVLYAAADGDVFSGAGAVLRLVQAGHGGNSWQLASQNFPSPDGVAPQKIATVSVDGTGVVYAAAGRHVWESSDFGATWNLFFEGYSTEEFKNLLPTPNGPPISAGNVGLNLLAPFGSLPLVPPTAPSPIQAGTSCSIVTTNECLSGLISSRTRCPLVIWAQSALGTPLAKTRYLVQKSADGANWKLLKSGKTNRAGSAALRMKPKKTLTYRLVIPKPICVSTSVTISSARP